MQAVNLLIDPEEKGLVYETKHAYHTCVCIESQP